MSTESFVNSFDSSTTTATPMASPLPDKPLHLPKYLELIYDENDAPPPPLSPLAMETSVDTNFTQTPYEIPINLNAKNNQSSHSVPIVESSNCSSLSGDESSMQALLGQAPPPPPSSQSSSLSTTGTTIV